ncbi:hydroxymethylglutaryl-CoA synthase family protein [Flavobacterium sp.]|jgi:hydroxymethylglutaryl-CoA synthase|uniref:hydroxymethylglutaryl-CoA synthase family protein n=1 Tax=Flavobacterium sp. TaxID=239 RepID=UPI0037BEB159
MKVGIDSISIDLPKIHLPIQTLAVNRDIEPDKLIKGLGLQKMSFPDVHNDVVTFATNAVFKLLQQEQINPQEISRIYVGTESSVDSSKPIASYITALLEQHYGSGSFRKCDTLDMTFACIGAVDALQTTLDFIRLNPTKKAIVVATDNAKYDLNSSGEYTQGAGAIAMLITANPRLLAFSNEVGISADGVFDFFKPRRNFTKNEILNTTDNPEWFGILENEISIYKEQPVFDGHYSNECYINRTSEAYFNFKELTNKTESIYKNWENVLMHLPYCFQARRTFVEIYAKENQLTEEIKVIAKSEDYLDFVSKAIFPSEIASGQIGNMYTGSIFLGLLSTLEYHLQNDNDIVSKKMGFIAYGSGSKAKVFEAEVQPDWKNAVSKVGLFDLLNNSTEIDFGTYISLHKKERKQSVLEPKNEFVLDYIEKENPVLIGARYYKLV